jgi:hypothetical protein
LSVQAFVQSLTKDLKLPNDSVGAITKRLQQQILHLKTIWENKLAQLAAMTGVGASPCVKTFEINANLGTVILRDQFEWDIHNMNFTPEAFARSLAIDMAIPRHEEVLLAHAIRLKLFEFWEATLHESLQQTIPSRRGASVVRPSSGNAQDEPQSLWGPTLEKVVNRAPSQERRDQAKEDRVRRLKARVKRKHRDDDDDDEEDDEEEDDEDDEDDE